MQKRSFLLGGFLGGLTSLLLMAASYLGQQLANLPFIPFDLFDWLARVLRVPLAAPLNCWSSCKACCW
jgi:hypothetical protein